MPFQTTVSTNMAAGVVGDIAFSGPRRCQSFILNSADATYNVFGRGFSKVAGQEGVAAAGNSGGTAVFAGILVGPKGSALLGTSTGGTLAPSLVLPNNAQGELLTMGQVWVVLPAAAAIGDIVVYDNTTGVLSTVAPGAALPSGKSWAHAVVDVLAVTAAGLALITVTDTPPAPTTP